MILGKGSETPNQPVKVTLQQNGRVLEETYVDSQGNFAFLELNEGDYQVTIESPGYKTYEHDASLRYPAHSDESFTAYLTPLEPISEESSREFRWSMAFEHPEAFQEIAPRIEIESLEGKIQLFMGVPANQVSFRKSKSEYYAEILFGGQIYQEDGEPLSNELPINRGFRVTLTEKEFLELGTRQMAARAEVQLAPGNYRLVLLVEDGFAGTLGSTVQEFVIP